MLTIRDIVSETDVFAGLAERHLELIAGCGWLAHFEAGAFVFREGEPADRFYVLRRGRATLEVAAPGRGAISVQTLRAGDTLGWSWLFPPYRWQLDARAVEPLHTAAFDGACLRGKCEEEHELGYQLMRRFAELMLQSLMATRLQLLDVYGHAVG